jgi:tetratricopeptide (TPR) repeat protein
MKKRCVLLLFTLGFIIGPGFGLRVARSQDPSQNPEYQKQLEEWEKKKAAIEAENKAKLATSEGERKENEKKRAYNDGNSLLKRGQYAEALAAYEQSLKVDSTFAKAHYGRGLALKGLRRPQEAIKAYQTAIRLDPADDAAYFALGKIYSDLEQHDNAISVYQKAIEREPNSYKAYYELGLSYQKKNQFKEAVEVFRKATQLNSNYHQAFYALGSSLNKLGNNQEALAALQNAVAWKDKHLVYILQAEILLQMDKHEEALQTAQEALKAKPNSAAASYYAGRALKDMGRYSEAIAYFSEAKKDRAWQKSADYEIDGIQQLQKQ